MTDLSRPPWTNKLPKRIKTGYRRLGNFVLTSSFRSIFLLSSICTFLIFLLSRSKWGGVLHELVPYWQLLFLLVLVFALIRLWNIAARASVVVLPFDITPQAPPKGLTALALSRMVFDGIQSALDEQQEGPTFVKEVYSFESDIPKAAQPTPDLGPGLALDYKGVSVELVLNFMRRLRGTLALVTGELFVNDSGVVIRCRCLLPAVFGASLSKTYHESRTKPLEVFVLREAVEELSNRLAADLRRVACHQLSGTMAGRALAELGKRYYTSVTRDRSWNLKEAIRCYDEAFRLFEKNGKHAECADVLNNRGNAFRQLPGPNRIENLRTAVACYDQALAFCTRDERPREWAGTMSNRALALQQMPDPYRDSNLAEAFYCYDSSLVLLDSHREDQAWGRWAGTDWARTSRNKANALIAKPGPNHIMHVEQGLESYESILTFFRERKNTKEFANTMMSKGAAYRQFPGPDRIANLREAIRSFDSALEVYTRNRYAPDWAQIMIQKGATFRELAGTDRVANLRQAISCFDQVLEVFTKDRYPSQWASTMNQRGIAFRELPGPDRLSNLKEAIRCFGLALDMFPRDTYPVEWADTENLLGTAYQQLPGPDRFDNLNQAMRCYELSLEVRVRESFPVQWAQTARNRANAYRELPGPDHAANLREAIRGYDEVLEVYTQLHYPEEWANTMRQRGNAFRDLRVPHPDAARSGDEEVEPQPKEHTTKV